MKFLRNKKNSLLLILSLFIFGSTLIFSPFSFEKLARAFNGNYNRTNSEDTIDLQDWNWLDDDFLLRDGSNTMDGDLNMNGNRVTNLDTPANTDLNHGATVEYVNDAISAAASAGGGDTFVNWGKYDCPSGTDTIYKGIAFSSAYNSISGGAKPICMKVGDVGGPSFTDHIDKMYPLVLDLNAELPPGNYDNDKIVQCALCHKPQGTCFEYYGSQNCGDSLDFNPVYSGYVFGSHSNILNTADSNSYRNPTERACLNSLFDNTISADGNLGALWFASIIDRNYGLPYTTEAFIKCSICCN